MRNIVVVECVSTGTNFIADIKNRNYNPIVLNTKLEESANTEIYDKFKKTMDKIDEDFVLIEEKDTYDETLELVRQYDPLLIVPGSKRGVRLATQLSHDLGLLGNPIENLDAYTLKDKMQEKIAEEGLRCIKGKKITSVDEAIEYYDGEGLKEVVVKPVYSAGAVGLKICKNRQELIDCLGELFAEVNMYGEKNNELIIQERLIGREYVVNTVSCNGIHRITTMWEHIKTITPSEDYVFDYAKTINELNLGEADLIEYAYDVVDALGIKYGAVHGEYLVDENGPVLIEVNCRPMGAAMDAAFMDRISGQHETDSILDSYLNPKKFIYQKNRGYELYEHGVLKYLIVPQDIVAESSPMKYISNKLKSHYKTSQELNYDSTLFLKTENLETIGGTIYLNHPDEAVIQNDLDFLCRVEKYAFQLVLSNRFNKKTIIDEKNGYEDVKNILNVVYAYDPVLLVTDNIFDDINPLQVFPDEIDNLNSEFDCVIVNLSKSIIDKKDDLIAYLMLKIIGNVKTSGIILIPKSTYQYMPNGRIGVEALIKVLDLKLEMPIHDLKGCVVASKK